MYTKKQPLIRLKNVDKNVQKVKKKVKNHDMLIKNGRKRQKMREKSRICALSINDSTTAI